MIDRHGAGNWAAKKVAVEPLVRSAKEVMRKAIVELIEESNRIIQNQIGVTVRPLNPSCGEFRPGRSESRHCSIVKRYDVADNGLDSQKDQSHDERM